MSETWTTFFSSLITIVSIQMNCYNKKLKQISMEKLKFYSLTT